MKAIIAADLAPLKLGSIELTFAAVGRSLEQAAYDVRFWFSGNMSQSVRDHFDFPQEKIEVNLGELSEASAWSNWCGRLKSERPELIWLNFFPSTGAGIRQLRRACPNSRICVSDHISRGFPRRNPLKHLRRKIKAFWSRNCVDAYIAVSGFVAGRMKQVDHIDPLKIHVIYNAVDLSRFVPSHQAGTCIVCVSHMQEGKGVQVLLEALSILKDHGKSPRCRLVGTGSNLRQYHELAQHLAIDVEFLGLRDDVPEILRTAMITVVPSIWPEAFSYVAAESQAVGVPVIASRVGGLPEVVDEGVTGLLVPPGDAEALATAIMDLIGNSERREAMGAAGRRRAVEHFDLSNAAVNIAAILSKNS